MRNHRIRIRELRQCSSWHNSKTWVSGYWYKHKRSTKRAKRVLKECRITRHKFITSLSFKHNSTQSPTNRPWQLHTCIRVFFPNVWSRLEITTLILSFQTWSIIISQVHWKKSKTSCRAHLLEISPLLPCGAPNVRASWQNVAKVLRKLGFLGFRGACREVGDKRWITLDTLILTSWKKKYVQHQKQLRKQFGIRALNTGDRASFAPIRHGGKRLHFLDYFVFWNLWKNEHIFFSACHSLC